MVRNELEVILVRLEELESREIEEVLDRLDRKKKEVYKGKKCNVGSRVLKDEQGARGPASSRN